MMFTVFMLLTHSITDFIFQSEDIVSLKKNMKFKGYFAHSLHLFLLSAIFLTMIKINDIAGVAIKIGSIVIIHIILDVTKDLINNRTQNKKMNSIVFILDQLSRIVVILLLTRSVDIHYNEVCIRVASIILGSGLTYYNLIKNMFLIIYISFSGAYLVPLILDLIYENVPNYSKLLDDHFRHNLDDKNLKPFIDKVKTGKWIGIIERMLVTILLVNNQISAIGFIIAVKSLTRFKQLENKVFAEYYLLGTLLSVSYTFAAYALLNNFI